MSIFGYPKTGMGKLSMWGLSPAIDLLDVLDVEKLQSNSLNLNILLVGENDGRHVLKTMENIETKYSSKDIRVNFYIMENCLELYSRQMILHMLALQPLDKIGVAEKTKQFMEIFGNTLIRPQTRRTVVGLSSNLIKMISDDDSMLEEMPLFSIAEMKFNERDAIAEIFNCWKIFSDPAKFAIKTHWDERLRQYLGSRYDSRCGVFDYDYSMYLSEKDPDARIITSKEYINWRNTGVAFNDMDSEYSQPNLTLISNTIINGAWKQSFWGDIVTGPFIAHGLRCKEKSLFVKINEAYKNSTMDITKYNLENMFSAISPGTDLELKSKALKYSINFLPIDSCSKLAARMKYRNFFHIAYFGVHSVQNLSEDVTKVLKSNGITLAERANYAVEFKADNLNLFQSKVNELATKSGLVKQDDYQMDYLRFIKISPDEAQLDFEGFGDEFDDDASSSLFYDHDVTDEEDGDQEVGQVPLNVVDENENSLDCYNGESEDQLIADTIEPVAVANGLIEVECYTDKGVDIDLAGNDSGNLKINSQGGDMDKFNRTIITTSSSLNGEGMLLELNHLEMNQTFDEFGNELIEIPEINLKENVSKKDSKTKKISSSSNGNAVKNAVETKKKSSTTVTSSTSQDQNQGQGYDYDASLEQGFKTSILPSRVSRVEQFEKMTNAPVQDKSGQASAFVRSTSTHRFINEEAVAASGGTTTAGNLPIDSNKKPPGKKTAPAPAAAASKRWH